jgi:(2Fe-2S) ferredoxin
MRSIHEPPNTYIVVCRGPNCRERGGLALRKRLVQLVRGESQAQLLGYHCFGQCERGPNVVFYPSDEWRGDLSADDARALVDHACGARESPGKTLEPPADERALHLANVAELVATVERDKARRRRARWWWPF